MKDSGTTKQAEKPTMRNKNGKINAKKLGKVFGMKNLSNNKSKGCCGS